MGKSRQYKILYDDGSQKEVKTTDFWCFSNNDIPLNFSDGGHGIDFEYLRKIDLVDQYTITILERRLNSNMPGINFHKDFDNFLLALCSHSQITNDINKKTYKKLRSLFGMGLINHSTYAFPLFKIDEKEKYFYSLPFDGNRQAYSIAVFSILSNIFRFYSFNLWGVIPFYLDEIQETLCSYIFPFSNADIQAENSLTTILCFKNQEQLKQERQFICDIINQYRAESLLVDFPVGYKKFRHEFKNFVNSYCTNPSQLTHKEANEIKALFNCIDEAQNPTRNLSDAIKNLAKPLDPIKYVAQQKSDAFDLIDAVFTKSFSGDIGNLYKKMFAFMEWIDIVHNRMVEESKFSHNDMYELTETYCELFDKYFKHYLLDLPHTRRLGINIHQEFK